MTPTVPHDEGQSVSLFHGRRVAFLSILEFGFRWDLACGAGDGDRRDMKAADLVGD